MKLETRAKLWDLFLRFGTGERARVCMRCAGTGETKARGDWCWPCKGTGVEVYQP